MNIKRIAKENNVKKRNEVTYVMTSSFRLKNNHSLYHAISNYKEVSIIIYHIPESNERNNNYINKHLLDIQSLLFDDFNVIIAKNEKDILNNIKGDVVLDMAYLREEKELQESIINFVKDTSYYAAVESNVLVPVTVASDKEAYSARTIRPKIHRLIDAFIDPVDSSNKITKIEKEALQNLELFIQQKLDKYDMKNHPEYEYQSQMSVYLKYGIISPLTIYLRLSLEENVNKASFIEELVVRRELAYNFVYYNENYDQFQHMTYEWAYQTMNAHQYDDKAYLYSLEDYISFNTHDPYFNTAMKEMVYFGYMHGYMRMYWCKKIIEWSPSFEVAYKTAIYLNNHYFLDGNTPNGFTGVAWCFGKHDRAWTERLIFGKLRYMNDNGLKRKFDIELYVKRIDKKIRESN